MTNYCTDLGQFTSDEIKVLGDIINALAEQGLPDMYLDVCVRPTIDIVTRAVFLANLHGKKAMLNGGKLEMYHRLPYCGKEGFLAELIAKYSPLEMEFTDIDYLLYAADIADYDLPEKWSNLTIRDISGFK